MTRTRLSILGLIVAGVAAVIARVAWIATHTAHCFVCCHDPHRTTVSGATSFSNAYIQSLQSALTEAQLA